jgi:hypothetical protein
MKKILKVEIEINDIIPRYCSKECRFLEDFYDSCQLFGIDLCGDEEKDVYFRCKSCLEQEIKDD